MHTVLVQNNRKKYSLTCPQVYKVNNSEYWLKTASFITNSERSHEDSGKEISVHVSDANFKAHENARWKSTGTS